MKTKSYVLSAGQMKQYDLNTIEKLGIPGMVLMERAALSAAEVICEAITESAAKQKKVTVGRATEKKIEEIKVLAVCGCGNNGGDGFALTRLLAEKGMQAECILIGPEEKCSSQTKAQIQILRRMGMDILRNFEKKEYDIMIDALFGIGLTREIQGEYAEAVEFINASKALKISLDIPSGIDTDTGKVLGCAVKADKTVTFGFLKKGLCLYPGKDFAGEVICTDMGITETSFLGERPDTFTCFCAGKELLPKRSPRGNKGTFGKVLILAGSVNMAGAAILCAKAAYRMGAGMVKLVTREENRLIIQESLPEALLLTYTGEDESYRGKAQRENRTENPAFWRQWQESLDWADVYVAGCGCGQSTMITALLWDMLTQNKKPQVLDADALNLLSKEPKLLEIVQNTDTPRVLTPHPGELSRLLSVPMEEVKGDLCQAAALATQKYHSIVVAKDAVTAVVSLTGDTYLNSSGNSGMATAGSGDVLAGMIGGLLAQSAYSHEAVYEAAWKGVYLHGLAGNAVAFQKSEYAVMASDMIEALPDIINQGGSL